MSTRKPAVLFVVLAALLLAVLAACGGSQAQGAPKANSSSGGASTAAPSAIGDAAAASPTPLSTASAADIERIAHQIFPGPHPVGCNWHDRATCPVTDRLAGRLDELTAPRANGHGPSPPLCRCQNGADSVSLRPEGTASGGVAHVTLDYGGIVSDNLDLIIVVSSGRLLVDDTQCTGGGSSTSVYAAQLTDCSKFSQQAARSCSISGAASGSGTPALVSASVSGDTLTLTFSNGTPAFELTTQPSARFLEDPSGRPITLGGSAGERIVLRGFRGDTSNLTGVPKLLTSNGALLRQLSPVGDFEGVVSFGAGLSSPGCASVTRTQSSLVFHFVPVNGRG
jgi:hypothetical protein